MTNNVVLTLVYDEQCRVNFYFMTNNVVLSLVYDEQCCVNSSL